MLKTIFIPLTLLLVFCGGVCLGAEIELPVELGLTFDSGDMYPEMAENFRTQLEIARGIGSAGYEDAGVSLNVWTVRFDDDVDLLENSLPSGIKKDPVKEHDMGQIVLDLVDYFGDYLDEVWGRDWSYRAEEAAGELAGIKATTINYSYNIPPTKFYNIQLVSPCLDPRSLKLYEGTFLIISEILINMDNEEGAGE